jgi:hypothetical protein
MSQVEPLLPHDLDVEEAETANIQSLEQGMRSSSLDSHGNDAHYSLTRPTSRTRFQRGVRRAMIAKKLSEKRSSDGGGHQRQRNKVAQDMLRHIDETTKKGHARHLSFEDVAFMPPLFEESESADSEDDRDHGRPSSSGLHLTGTQYGTSPGTRNYRAHRRPANNNPFSKLFELATRLFWTDLLRVILRSPLVWVALPCAVAALILYYPLANPMIDFLPGSVTVAWWFNFIARQTVTLEMARLLEYVIVDSLLLKSRWDRSQLVSFVAYHIQGWPFVTIAWATIDLFVLHGNHRLQLHWLSWTRWRIYSREASSGAYILTSELYLRLLLSTIFLGVATAIKRCILELQFGGRLYTTFKPKLEQILRVSYALSLWA